MQYTESVLNGLRKDQVIDIALKLTNKIANYESGPITADSIKAAYLELKKEGIDIGERREKSKTEFNLAIAKINADKEKQIAELELKYGSNDGKDAKELDKLYKELEEKSLKAIKDLTFGLEKAENDTNIEIAKLQAKMEVVQKQHDELIADLDKKTKEAESKYKENIDNMQNKHIRDVEQLNYDNAIALRDENKKFIDEAAKKLSSVVVNEADYKELVDFKADTTRDYTETLEKEINAAKSAVYASEGAKFNNVKVTYEKDIALLQNDKLHLTNTVKSQEDRIKDLELRLKDVPSQIAEAVKSSRADITVNQDSNKK